jgi:hypothetical protein
MPDEIKPALTPEEWTAVLNDDRPPADSWASLSSFMGEGKRQFVFNEEYFVEDDARHSIAALALHEQPFGFTHEDVDALREEADDEWSGVREPNRGTILRSVADRIEALLPPR